MSKQSDDEIDEFIIEELEVSIENLTEPEDKDFVETLRRVVKKMRDGGEYTPEELKALESEILDFEDKDFWQQRKEKKRLQEVQAKFGFLEEYDPLTQYSKKPKTRIIDGKRWIVG